MRNYLAIICLFDWFVIDRLILWISVRIMFAKELIGIFKKNATKTFNATPVVATFNTQSDGNTAK